MVSDKNCPRPQPQRLNMDDRSHLEEIVVKKAPSSALLERRASQNFDDEKKKVTKSFIKDTLEGNALVAGWGKYLERVQRKSDKKKNTQELKTLRFELPQVARNPKEFKKRNIKNMEPTELNKY
jgi:hypothetical protein